MLFDAYKRVYTLYVTYSNSNNNNNPSTCQPGLGACGASLSSPDRLVLSDLIEVGDAQMRSCQAKPHRSKICRLTYLRSGTGAEGSIEALADPGNGLQGLLYQQAGAGAGAANSPPFPGCRCQTCLHLQHPMVIHSASQTTQSRRMKNRQRTQHHRLDWGNV